MTKKKNSGVRLEDFPINSLLHQVAKVDIDLACRLASQYGGSKVYICQLDTIKKAIRNRQILNEVCLCRGKKFIAKDLGLSVKQVQNIVNNTDWDMYYVNNPLPDAPV